ncbi:hypothetical protein, partial [uncultured Alistipes sp.]|uniref:hypothetical protein n=1 Tax=uncultured Alistipes sp. TaxID=538949 RepID=UPI00262EA602
VRSPVSPEHAASSSSASVNRATLFSASTARVANRRDRVIVLLIGCPAAENPADCPRGHYRRIEEKRIKIKNSLN